jgi:hypothetical protein
MHITLQHASLLTIIHQGLAEVFSVFIVKFFSYFIDNVIFLSYSSASRF